MKILGIETSCDETAVAVVQAENNRFRVLSNVVSSQVAVHNQWGGVVPNLAKREHQRNLVLVLRESLREAGLLRQQRVPIKTPQFKVKIKSLGEILARERLLYLRLRVFLEKYQKPDINLISVTQGLGLEPALWVGINFAKALSFFWQKPVLPINHIEAHLLVNFLHNDIGKAKYPAVCLTVSGGHTMIVLMRDLGAYTLIGETRDDSAGECFDKTARLLGLGYPGGPAVARAAKRPLAKYKTQIKLPRPMINTKENDFSFSGLKTAVLYHYQAQPPNVRKSKNYVSAMAAEIQQAIIDVLIQKTVRAAKEHRAKTVMLGGGVAANEQLREQLKQKLEKELPQVSYFAPEPKLCTDNGVMAAIAGYFARQRGESKEWTEISAQGNLKI